MPYRVLFVWKILFIFDVIRHIFYNHLSATNNALSDEN